MINYGHDKSRGVTYSQTMFVVCCPFLLTRLSRGVTIVRNDQLFQLNISTHTPLARRDAFTKFGFRFVFNFYSHASREA